MQARKSISFKKPKAYNNSALFNYLKRVVQLLKMLIAFHFLLLRGDNSSSRYDEETLYLCNFSNEKKCDSFIFIVVIILKFLYLVFEAMLMHLQNIYILYSLP